MIVAVAAAAALTTSKEALIGRWLRANQVHAVARLASVPAQAATPPDLRVLAQREFSVAGRYRLTQPLVPAAPRSWWSRAWQWAYDRWQDVWRRLFARVHVGREEVASMGDALLAIAGLVILFVVVRLLRNLQIARSGSRVRSEPLEESPAPRAIYKQACDSASRGDYGKAALLLFAATVTLLDREGAVDGSTSATVGDLRRELRLRNAALVAPFDAVAAPFVQKAYAERAVDEPQWLLARDAFAALLQEGALR